MFEGVNSIKAVFTLYASDLQYSSESCHHKKMDEGMSVANKRQRTIMSSLMWKSQKDDNEFYEEKLNIIYIPEKRCRLWTISTWVFSWTIKWTEDPTISICTRADCTS